MTSSSPASGSLELGTWTGARIHEECRAAYANHERRLREHYRDYFKARPRLASGHPLLAKNLEAALPEGWERLAKLIPRKHLHRWHLSGKSSQTLGLGLIGAAREADPSGQWLWDALKPALPSGGPLTSLELEQSLAPSVLNEQPRQTAVDLLVESDDQVLCVEMKWAEAGMGTCSCKPRDKQLIADCAERVLDRTRYWEAADEVLGLPPRHEGTLCPISWTYQVARNVAAARALANGRQPVFALIHDDTNPYFGGHGDWPGWPRVLDQTINTGGSDVRFASVSWQTLVPIICSLVGMDAVREWAQDKHQLRA